MLNNLPARGATEIPPGESNCIVLLPTDNFKPGVYAISVTGRLPLSIVRELKSRGIVYRSRDTSTKA